MNDIYKNIDKIVFQNMLQLLWMVMEGGLKKWISRVIGHEKGVNSVKAIVEASVELNISVLTLYAFSTENWNRPEFEINAVMGLLVSSLNKESSTFKNTIFNFFQLVKNIPYQTIAERN
ncbi:MAG: hypothetical protein CM15mP23_16920 [Cryomorphaceae bacterium]|nr:MAG: hypothetical protein CM15mP23_16920 [Cryomorphaceae bacterium]